MKRTHVILLSASAVGLGLLLASCSNLTNRLPTPAQNPNEAVPTTSQALALPSDTPLPAASQAATAPAEEAARPSNPGGPGPAVNLTGDPTQGKAIFDQICSACHGPNGTKGIANPGSDDGSVPTLNPIDPTIANANPKIFAQNVDLFVEHGSTPSGPNPTTKMPSFGDSKILTPQQIANVISYVILLNSPAAAVTQSETVEPTVPETAEATSEPARPSNPGGPGQALTLTGDAAQGQAIFSQICSACHGPQGTKGIANPGSNDGSVPTLNPIDPTIANANPKIFAMNVDLFVEHGSTPEGPNPTTKMPSFGDSKILTPQQIADVIAYVISLNPQK